MKSEVSNYPRLGVAALVENDAGEFLIAKRAKEPFLGRWVLPGGGVRPFERLEDALNRELLEETGITIAIKRLLSVREIISKGGPVTITHEHRVVLFYCATSTGGIPRPGSDVSSVRFADRATLTLLRRTRAFTPTIDRLIAETLGV